ncbi:MAG: hypothetical protein NT069_18225, partial [Planctomycetota bacterium]|nr:hypothetical protein [Planctomycetota bacterium]
MRSDSLPMTSQLSSTPASWLDRKARDLVVTQLAQLRGGQITLDETGSTCALGVAGTDGLEQLECRVSVRNSRLF